MREVEPISEMLAESSNAGTFGRMMTAGEEVDSRFPGERLSPFGWFPGDESVESKRDGFVQSSRGASRNETHPGNLGWALEKRERTVIEGSCGTLEQGVGGDRLRVRPSDPHRGTLEMAERRKRIEAERPGAQHIVAEFGMAVERKMKSEKMQSGLHEETDTPRERSLERKRLSGPEKPVVNHHAIRLQLDRALEKSGTSRDSGHDMFDLARTLHLETVRAGIRLPARRE